MKPNEIAREQIMGIVENQLKANDPIETKQTFERLVNSGISKANAKIHLAQCVSIRQ